MKNMKECRRSKISGQWSVARFFAQVGLAASLLVIRAAAQQTNNYTLNRWTIASGGGTTAGGGYSLSYTIGQPLAGTVTGTNYTLTAGFWAVAIQTPGSPLLQITNTAGSVTLSWTQTNGAFVLQRTFVLWPPNHVVWSPVSAPYQTNSTSVYVTVPATNGSQFFRLQME